MKSFGAMNIEIKQNGKPVKLKKGVKARITIPVDTISILTKETIGRTIPFLTYNTTTGIWEQEGTAILNATKTAYEGWTTHFSSFNMDQNFSNPSCYKICNTISLANLKIEISAPYYHLFNVSHDCTSGTCPGSGSAHAISNIDPYSAVGIKMLDYTNAANPTVVSTYVFVAGDTKPAPTCPYDNCTGTVIVADTVARNFVATNKLSMCNIQLASPQRKTSGSAGPFPIRLAWLYDDDFAATAAAVRTFDIESSTNGTTGWAVMAGGTNLSSAFELVHHFDPAALAAGTYFFRVIRKVGGVASGNYSNRVGITIDNFGGVTYLPVAQYPAFCF
jgi:hypothetical protein